MKLTTILLIATFMQVSAASFAQRVTYSNKQASLEQIFKEIRKQTGYNVLWSENNIKNAPAQDINFKDTPLMEVLDKILADLPLTYEIQDKTVLIKTKEPSLLDRVKATIAPVTVTGKVTNELGEPMSGVTVKQKFTEYATATDSKGNYSITVTDNNPIVVFSYIGYEVQEINAKNILPGSTIVMKAVSTNLKEVVVNKGYYFEKNELETGDVSSISANVIGQQPISNPLEALEGRIPGLFITQQTGSPDGSFQVRLRGQNSILQGNDPLYVIDGVPYPSEMLINENNVGNGGNPLNFINPSDIQTIDVLKDADATAIYGSQGANGVILITTKKGKVGAMKVNASVYDGIGQVSHFLDLTNTQQYLQMRHEAFVNDGVTPTVANAPDLLLWDTTRYTNWQKALIGGTANYKDAQVSLSGGSTNTQFLVGGAYHRETTVFPSSFSDQKGSFHFNLTTSSNNQKLKAMFTGSYMNDLSNMPYTDPTGLISNLAPDAPPAYNADGTLNWAPSSPGSLGTWSNPYAQFVPTYTSTTNNLVANGNLSYELIPGLNLKASMGYTNMQMNEVQETPLTFYDPALWSQGNSLRTGNYNTTTMRTWIFEPQINYKKSIGKGSLTALIGGTIQNSIQNQQYLQGSGYSSDALIGDIQAASSITTNNVTENEYRYSAIFGRLNYTLLDKYVVNLTVRRDGSSRFGSANQFHDFGAVGAAWIFSKEDLVKSIFPFLSFGKLRASYGTTGNDQIPNYGFLSVYNNTPYSYENTVGLVPKNLPNPYLAWELNKKLEGGLDLGFLEDRITVSFSYFQNRSSNELVSYPLPGVTGFTSISSNLPATVQNTGFETSITTANIKSKKFTWTTSFNLTANQNKLISFPNLANSSYSTHYVIGQPLSIVKVFEVADVNPSTGVYEFRAANGSLTYNPNFPTDLTGLVNVNPKFYGGLSNTVKYERFQLDFFFQFVKQTGTNYLYNYSSLPAGWLGLNPPTAVLNNWRAPGNISNFQGFTESPSSGAFNSTQNYLYNSNLAYGDASYIRLKNLSLSYEIPDAWKKKLGMSDCSVFFRGENILTITNHYLGYDPETQSINNLPLLRILSLGLHVTL